MSKDLFSKQAADYARYRPSYPPALIEYVLEFVENKSLAWDCATGNGQAARALATSFKKVVATDVSEKQLALAKQTENIEYLRCPAEQTPFTDNIFDLVTIAQAYHWFNFTAFEKEVRRVSKPGAVIAAWGYNLITTYDAAIDSMIKKFYTDIIGPYWDEERKFVEDNYKTVPFNFSALPEKDFSINAEWTRDNLVGYFNSWSAVRNFIDDKNHNPVDLIVDELSAIWGKEEVKPVAFPLFLRIGRV